MKYRSVGPLLILATTILAPAPLLATGDFFEEPLTSLPDFLKLDQLPAKTFREILAETAQPAPKVDELDMDEEIKAFDGLAAAKALPLIDKLTTRARATRDMDALNLLNDLRDLYSGPAKPAEIADYLAWRPGNTAYDAAELETRIEKGPASLRPHYLYLRGAVLFLEDNDTDSQKWFERVLKEFPKHPRAEIALFMSARCQLSRSRKPEYTQRDPVIDPAQRPRAKQLLEQYLAKYPKGRWAGDALGWLGAWHYDGAEPAAALRCYLGQIDMRDHPELAGPAAIMCEQVLSRLASAPDAKVWNDIAKNPPAAQALVYLLLNSTESDNYNGSYDSADEVRAWRKKVLPQVAAAISAQDKLYQGAQWRPRYLGALALAASDAGQQEQALKILGTASADAESDDLLLARGVVLQRAKRSKEAIEVLRTLIDKFPKSSLARGARLRLGLALADDHRAGEAIFELDKLLAPADPAPADAEEKAEDAEPEIYPIYYPLTNESVRQLIDLWLNFAPVDELAAPTLAPNFDPVQRLRLTEPIAQRLLAKEQFEEAKKYLTPAKWDLTAGPLDKLTKAARDAKEPAAKAAAYLKLGDAWGAARGQVLTYPLDTDDTRTEVYPNEAALAQLRRGDAAAVLSLPGNFRLDLENRDELRHAFNWWLEASDAHPGTATTATALWRALKAMPAIADVSLFTYDRAVAKKWGDVSRKLYDRLRTECADSPEAKRLAVYWDLPPRKKPDENQWQGAYWYRTEAGQDLNAIAALIGEESDFVWGDEARKLRDEILTLEERGDALDVDALRKKIDALRTRARASFDSLDGATWINLLDDLALFFQEPDPGREVRGRYVAFRFRFLREVAVGDSPDQYKEYRQGPRPSEKDELLQKDIRAALAEPATNPVADYFEFLHLAVTANHLVNMPLAGIDKGSEDNTYRSRDYVKLAKGTRDFIDKFPKSRKREAAMLVHARAVFQASNPAVFQKHVTWPVAARWEGGSEPLVAQQEKFDAKKVLAALDAYDKAFPKGRYAGDVRLYRASVALRQDDWKKALALSIAQFDETGSTALQGEAAKRIGQIFLTLTEDEKRADVLAAIKASPRARELLTKYLAYESEVHPLRFMRTWLRDQLAAR